MSGIEDVKIITGSEVVKSQAYAEDENKKIRQFVYKKDNCISNPLKKGRINKNYPPKAITMNH